MLCNNCGNDMPLGQRTCGSCGSADEIVSTVEGPAVFTIVEQTEVALPFEPADRRLAARRPPEVVEPAAAADRFGSIASLSDDVSRHTTSSPTNTPTVPATSGARALIVIAVVAGLASIGGAFMLISTITSDAPIAFFLGDYGLNDLGGGTNFQVAFVLDGALLLLGALVVRRGGRAERLGAGLIAGAGIAIVPFTVFMWASADAITDRALIQAEAVAVAGGGGQVFESTLGAGFFVLVGACVVGAVAAFVALGSSGNDGREPLDTTLCVIGAISCLAAAVGQLIPENGARFVDNIQNDFNSWPHVYSRLGMIVVVGVVGVTGLLLANRFGLGLTIGAISVYVWQWATSMLDAGDYPAPPGLGNPGGTPGHPHIVTTAGIVATLVVIAALGAAASRPEPESGP